LSYFQRFYFKIEIAFDFNFFTSTTLFHISQRNYTHRCQV
jgi:hypothetical protein